MFVACAVMAAACGCSGNPRPNVTPASSQAHFLASEVIAEVKDFAVALGGHATENFRQPSARQISDNRCYFTGKLQLPEFYSTLRMVREDEERCAARSGEHDVFFYPVQAVASGEETITVSLAEAPTERLLVVVPHEDFHNQPEARKAPTEVAEAAATLVGFVTAREFANGRFGAESRTARMLARDADLFLRKSFVVNQYYDKLSGLYHDFGSGAITPAQTLERKAALFAELQHSCAEIAPEPASFNKCPAAMNNAGLAFDRTYTRHYPILHDLYELLGGDTPALVSTLKRLMTNWPNTAATAADLLKAE
ncbi:MAG: aminopeptidase [Vicinamibacterales bacterium]